MFAVYADRIDPDDPLSALVVFGLVGVPVLRLVGGITTPPPEPTTTAESSTTSATTTTATTTTTETTTSEADDSNTGAADRPGVPACAGRGGPALAAKSLGGSSVSVGEEGVSEQSR